jgi:D-arabinose 1-dehydrogenase-like Zn-dependent alcohol dehydrogenase
VDVDGLTEVLEWSSGGVDVALEASGARGGFDAAVDSLRPGGRLVVCGYEVGVEYGFESSRLPLKELTLLGARGGSREDGIEALAAVEEGWLRPTVSEVMPLNAVNNALERLAAGEVIGRIAINPAG